ncbi:cupin domain-containing protein [Azospirillum sp. YIM DDC1]|uniref:Cupin domain-containing protein n=1 Tax=Azospirillum aestuarii TaxID=2802052 RepID=A0ABS1HTU4_9PROT|nr:cupin domain-containing protein [Azospirillum aestuarii]MBK4718259.1 cupin domain-containing protein [Azospirillum aestuarii]TWA94877.1 cupin 2 domain-containing protein [Azospirillum brasilense]
MSVPAGNLLAGLPSGSLPPDALPGELFTTLTDTAAASGTVRIERILSTGQASPEGFWYEQDWDEFVLVVQGAARLQLEGEAERALGPGDWVMIPARRRHRVAWTDPDAPTVWLAVHIGEPKPPHKMGQGETA